MSSGGGRDDEPIRTPARPVKVKSGKGGAGDVAENPCNIVERTKVNSPDRTVAATVRKNDVLEVEYDQGPPKRLLVRTSSRSILGSITSPSMPQIIQCIISGHAYEALILSIAGGMIEIQVQPK